MSKIVLKNQPCINCESPDARQVYEDNTSFCFRCLTMFDAPEKKLEESNLKVNILFLLETDTLEKAQQVERICNENNLKFEYSVIANTKPLAFPIEKTKQVEREYFPKNQISDEIVVEAIKEGIKHNSYNIQTYLETYVLNAHPKASRGQFERLLKKHEGKLWDYRKKKRGAKNYYLLEVKKVVSPKCDFNTREGKEIVTNLIKNKIRESEFNQSQIAQAVYEELGVPVYQTTGYLKENEKKLWLAKWNGGAKVYLPLENTH